MSVPLLIFDFDGTIADSVGHIVGLLQMAAQKHGAEPPPPELIKAGMGLATDMTVATAMPGADPELIYTIARQYEADYRAAQAHHHTSLFDGMQDMLEEFAQQNILAIATGKTRLGLVAVLETMPHLKRLFASTHTASDGPGKPHPAMIEAAIAENTADPRTTLMVGDAIWDMQMGCNAGVYNIGVTWGTMPRDALIESGADVVVDTVPELKTAIQNFLTR